MEATELDEGLHLALERKFDTMELPALVAATSEGDEVAVNDISFHRRQNGRVAELAYSVQGEELGEVRCDGLVVSTPAGSTGYNLANGGPVLAWGVEGYVVSFIAPHTLTAREIVVAPGDVLTVTNRSRGEDVDMTTDGHPCARCRERRRWTSASSRAARSSRSCRGRASTTASATSSGGWPTDRALRLAPARPAVGSTDAREEPCA